VKRRSMADNARKLSHVDAADRVATLLRQMVGR
jgi:UDP-N-acetylglucosamine:LPS N-acetylglucosamine transferase